MAKQHKYRMHHATRARFDRWRLVVLYAKAPLLRGLVGPNALTVRQAQ